MTKQTFLVIFNKSVNEFSSIKLNILQMVQFNLGCGK